jgi:hypothetical protein
MAEFLTNLKRTKMCGEFRATDIGKKVTAYGFVAKFEDNQINHITAISENEYDFYRSYKHLERMGFSEKAYQWSYIDCELDKLKTTSHTLANLYMHYNK